MSPTAVNVGLSAASSLWAKFNEYREKKALEAYAALEEVAKNVDLDSDELLPESRRRAGAVTKAAHARLEKALAEIEARRAELGDAAADRFADARKESGKLAARLDAQFDAEKAKKDARKRAQAIRKQARKDAKNLKRNASKSADRATRKLERRAGKKQSGSKFWPVAAVVALISAAAGGVYYWLRRNDTPSEVPPRVEEFSGGAAATGSTLVYTTSTTDDTAGEQTPSPAGDLVEDGVVERDEALLGSIEEQLARHRDAAGAQAEAPEDTDEVLAPRPTGESLAPEELSAEAEADDAAMPDNTARVTDDRNDEGKHRLNPDGSLNEAQKNDD